eukprot:gene1890-22492_t
MEMERCSFMWRKNKAQLLYNSGGPAVFNGSFTFPARNTIAATEVESPLPTAPWACQPVSNEQAAASQQEIHSNNNIKKKQRGLVKGARVEVEWEDGEFYIAAIVKRHTAGDSNGTYDVKYTDGSIGEFLTQAKHGLIPMPVVARHSKSKSSSSHKAKKTGYSERWRTVCTAPGCTTNSQMRGLCKKHGAYGTCTFPGCTTNAAARNKCSKHGALGFCKVPECKRFVKQSGKFFCILYRLAGLCITHGGGNSLAAKAAYSEYLKGKEVQIARASYPFFDIHQFCTSVTMSSAKAKASGKAERLAAAAKKLLELQGKQTVAKHTPVIELPVFKWLLFDAPERRQLIDQFQHLSLQEDTIVLKSIPKAQTKLEEAQERYKLSLALARNNQAAKAKQTKALIRRITENSNDTVQNVQAFVQHTSLAFSPGTLTGEVASAIEVFHSEVAFQGLKRKVQQLDARDAGKGGAGMKKADVELLVADRKHQRLLKTLRETEEVLLEQLAMGKAHQPSDDAGSGDMARTWMIVSQPFLRRLVFAKVDLTQQQFEHTQLIAEQKRIPERRIAMQEEIAQVASKQYKQLARKLHTDKGGSQDRFEEIKYAEMVLSDIRHTEKGGKTGPNLLVEYINMNDHDAFDSMLQRINMAEQKAGQNHKAVHAAKKKVRGVYVDADTDASSGGAAVQAQKKKVMAIESGTPPQCRMPRVTSRSLHNNGGEQGEVLVSWGPKHHLVTHFVVEAKVDGSGDWAGFYNGPKDMLVHTFKFPAVWSIRARAYNEHREGPFSQEKRFELADDGAFVDYAAIEAANAKLEAGKLREAKQIQNAERLLRMAVESAQTAMNRGLHADDRPFVIETLKRSLLDHRGKCPDQSLCTQAKDILVNLRKKELTREWRNELKRWTEALIEVELDDEEMELEIKVRIAALDPERLNWFYQHVLTRSTKVIEQYSGTLERMPIMLRPLHRRLHMLLKMVLLYNDSMKPKLRDEFSKKADGLHAGLLRSEKLEDNQEREEAARRQRIEKYQAQKRIEEAERREAEYKVEKGRRDKRLAREAQLKKEREAQQIRDTEAEQRRNRAEQQRKKEEKKKGGGKSSQPPLPLPQQQKQSQPPASEKKEKKGKKGKKAKKAQKEAEEQERQRLQEENEKQQLLQHQQNELQQQFAQQQFAQQQTIQAQQAQMQFMQQTIQQQQDLVKAQHAAAAVKAPEWGQSLPQQPIQLGGYQTWSSGATFGEGISDTASVASDTSTITTSSLITNSSVSTTASSLLGPDAFGFQAQAPVGAPPQSTMPQEQQEEVAADLPSWATEVVSNADSGSLASLSAKAKEWAVDDGVDTNALDHLEDNLKDLVSDAFVEKEAESDPDPDGIDGEQIMAPSSVAAMELPIEVAEPPSWTIPTTGSSFAPMTAGSSSLWSNGGDVSIGLPSLSSTLGGDALSSLDDLSSGLGSGQGASSSLGGSGFGIGNSGDWGGIGSSTGSDAFGALGSSSSAIKPPPGLGNTAAEVRKSPPGFGVKPPPGFAKSSDAASLAPSPATSAPPSPAHAPSKADAKVKSFLAEAGLSKYIEFFIENEIEYEELLELQKEDLVEMGMDKKGPLMKFEKQRKKAKESQNSNSLAGNVIFGSTW